MKIYFYRPSIDFVNHNQHNAAVIEINATKEQIEAAMNTASKPLKTIRKIVKEFEQLGFDVHVIKRGWDASLEDVDEKFDIDRQTFE